MRLFILSAFTFLSLFAYSQYQPLLYTWDDYNGTYSVSKIEENGDNFRILKIQTVTAEMLKKRNRQDLVTVLAKKGMAECNNVTLFETSKDGKTQALREDYWMLPGDEILNPNKESNKFYSEAEMSKILPQMFKSNQSQMYAFENRKIKTYDFDNYYQQHFVSQSDYIDIEHPTRTDKIASRATSNTTYNANSNSVIAVYPSEGNKEDKYASFKNYEIIISTPKGEILNQGNIELDYPRVYEEQKTVYDINDGTKSIGHILYFERLNAGKYADPDKENMQIVYVPNKGDIVSSVIKFRPDNKGWQKIHGVFGDGESLYIAYHAYGADGSFFGIKKINKNGESTDIKFTEDQLKENTILTPGNFGELNPSRKMLGNLSEKPEFRWGTQEFVMQGVQKTDTKLYIWGQAIYKLPDPNFKGEGVQTSISYYAEGFVFVYNNTDMTFEKMYMLNIPGDKKENTFNLISKNGDEVEFYIPIKSPEQKDYSKTVVNINSEKNARYAEDYKYLMSPLFMTIDGDNGKFQYYKDIYTLDLNKGLIECKDGSKYIVGFDVFAGEDRDDSGELAYRNKHYFHIIPLKY